MLAHAHVVFTAVRGFFVDAVILDRSARVCNLAPRAATGRQLGPNAKPAAPTSCGTQE
ncbi:hypothetical protein [Lujinxingia vulgaris]|uniref:hypothetical protein n=1 Tax=Lujinxingia vulgaris TaxID=2600176 RepID=UPI001E4CB273|nr:hypothetical protein [Lujinxingia vulgaris]